MLEWFTTCICIYIISLVSLLGIFVNMQYAYSFVYWVIFDVNKFDLDVNVTVVNVSLFCSSEIWIFVLFLILVSNKIQFYWIKLEVFCTRETIFFSYLFWSRKLGWFHAFRSTTWNSGIFYVIINLAHKSCYYTPTFPLNIVRFFHCILEN